MPDNGKDITRRSSRSEIDSFLEKVASNPNIKPAGNPGRLIFAMDATASREPTWDRACHIQARMFDATASLGGLHIQLCYYRGYLEFNYSPWLSQPDELLKQMTAVTCLGGNTQIEKVLRHAVRESTSAKIDAVVFVGDCMEEDIDGLCQLAGELGIIRVPVFLFQEGHDPIAARAFKQIARLTNGACCPFDAGSAAQLGELLSAVAVYAAGGHRALEALGKRRGGVSLQLSQQMKKD